MEDENLFFREEWLKEEKETGSHVYIVEGILTYRPIFCEKHGELDSSKIDKNGYKITEAQFTSRYK